MPEQQVYVDENKNKEILSLFRSGDLMLCRMAFLNKSKTVLEMTERFEKAIRSRLNELEDENAVLRQELGLSMAPKRTEDGARS